MNPPPTTDTPRPLLPAELNRSLVALLLELPPDVYADHRAHVEALAAELGKAITNLTRQGAAVAHLVLSINQARHAESRPAAQAILDTAVATVAHLLYDTPFRRPITPDTSPPPATA